MRIAHVLVGLLVPFTMLAQLPVPRPSDRLDRDVKAPPTFNGSNDCLTQVRRLKGGYQIRIGNDVFALDTTTIRVGMAGHDMQLRVPGVDLQAMFSAGSAFDLAAPKNIVVRVDAKDVSKNTTKSARITNGPVAGGGAAPFIALQCVVRSTDSKKDEYSLSYIVDKQNCLVHVLLVRTRGLERDVKMSVPPPAWTLDEVRSAFSTFVLEPTSPDAWRQLSLFINLGLLPWQKVHDQRPVAGYEDVRAKAMSVICDMLTNTLSRSVGSNINLKYLQNARAVACMAGNDVTTEHVAILSHACLHLWNGIIRPR
ncbi:hypothetical protein BH10BAC6_BH10BAC6_11530 [soil metagenome]